MPNQLDARRILSLGCITILTVCAMPLGASDDAAGTHVVRVSDTALDALARLNLAPRLELDYGTFVWLELSADDLDRLRAARVPFDKQQDPYVLRLGDQRFDPVRALPTFPAGWGDTGHQGPDLHLVQFFGPTRAEWLDRLAARGLKVVQYIFPNTYIVWGTQVDRGAAAQAGEVRWTGPFVPAYRVLPRWRNLPDTPQQVRALLYRGADTDQALGALAALGARIGDRRALNGVFEIVGLTLPGNAMRSAAAVPGVYSIKPVPTDGGLRTEMADQVNVNNVDPNNAAFPGYPEWLTEVGLSGAGVIIANVDGGIQDSHPDLVNRLIGCNGQTCGGGATSGHGTHTAGIMAADGASGTLDSFGFLRGLGQAPGASLVEQVYSPWFQQPGGMLLIMTDSYNNGASLSGNSWGPAGTPRGYDDDTMQVDIGVRDADPDAPGNQPLTFVLSFMNGNGGTSTQGTPDEAKNLFNIGSTKMQNSNGSQILDINDLSSNTAHGPALDGRTIPHMVAPGCRVDSTTSGSGYTLLCGTSMASPHVSGAVGLFIEYYRSLPGYEQDPSPAMMKGAFLTVAHDLAGFHDADGGILGHPFDSKQGWGRMDLEAVVDPQLTARYFDNPAVFDNTGEEWVINLAPVDPNQPMRMMLVWTDAPGHGLGGSAPAWNNNLDLIVEAGINTYRGNAFGPNGWSQPGGPADIMNNTEGVFLGPASPASVTVRVRAADINSDGVPNHGDITDQDFAFVCYNCAQEPGFTLSADPSALAICTPDDALYNIEIGQIMGFTEPVTLSAAGAPLGTTISFSANPVVPPGTSTMTVSNTGAANAGSYLIQIDGTAPTVQRSTTVALDVYSAVPGATTLQSPPNGAGNVALRPTFEWNAATQAENYRFELAADAGFSNVIETAPGLTGTTYDLQTLLETVTTYYWRVRAGNTCGEGGYSAVFSFTTRDMPAVLLVDDDDNNPNVRAYYTDGLAAIGQEFDLWDTDNSDDEPDDTTLGQYQMVIWFTGDEFGGASGPGAAGEAALASFLDGGGCLFMSSQDYFWDRDLTPFMAEYLGVQSASSDVSQTQVTGNGSVFGGMGPYPLSYPFSNYSDRISPNLSQAGVELAFSGNMGDAALSKDNGVYRTTFWGFPWEAVSNPSDRIDLLATVVNWCAAPHIPDCDGNGTPDIDDVWCDYDFDCDVDMADLGNFQLCFTGPGGGGLGTECFVFDVDGNGAIDLDDLVDFNTLFSGPE